MNWPVIIMIVGALTWLAGELLAVFTGRIDTDTTSAWVWVFERKTGWIGRGIVLVILLDLINHLVFGHGLVVVWSNK